MTGLEVTIRSGDVESLVSDPRFEEDWGSLGGGKVEPPRASAAAALPSNVSSTKSVSTCRFAFLWRSLREGYWLWSTPLSNMPLGMRHLTCKRGDKKNLRALNVRLCKERA